jgi:hypothetical protein
VHASQLVLKIDVSKGNSDSQESRIEDIVYIGPNIRRLRRKATQGTSQNEGEHGLPPARVLLPKILLIVLMFLDSPKRHLSNSEAGEYEC